MTQPGWYGEPGSTTLERYWDGGQWTPQIRQRPLTPPPAVPARPGLGVLGLVLVLLGTVAVVIALTAATWFHRSADSSLNLPATSLSAADLRDDPTVNGLIAAYVSWLGWLLLVLPASLGAVACFPVPHRQAARLWTLFAAMLGALLTFFAYWNVAWIAHVGFVDLAHVTSAGPLLAFVGFLVIAMGAAAAELGT